MGQAATETMADGADQMSMTIHVGGMSRMEAIPHARPLSPREKEVALLIARGYKDEEISKALYISRRRVGEIVCTIKEKWHVRSRVEIGVMVYHLGWLVFNEVRAE